MNEMEKRVWARVQAAIYATTVGRAAVELSWPECHKPRCNHRHPNPDEAFRLFTERVAETVQSELRCRSTTEPDMEDEAAA